MQQTIDNNFAIHCENEKSYTELVLKQLEIYLIWEYM